VYCLHPHTHYVSKIHFSIVYAVVLLSNVHPNPELYERLFPLNDNPFLRWVGNPNTTARIHYTKKLTRAQQCFSFHSDSRPKRRELEFKPKVQDPIHCRQIRTRQTLFRNHGAYSGMKTQLDCQTKLYHWAKFHSVYTRVTVDTSYKCTTAARAGRLFIYILFQI